MTEQTTKGKLQRVKEDRKGSVVQAQGAAHTEAVGQGGAERPPLRPKHQNHRVSGAQGETGREEKKQHT